MNFNLILTKSQTNKHILISPGVTRYKTKKKNFQPGCDALASSAGRGHRFTATRSLQPRTLLCEFGINKGYDNMVIMMKYF